jgi:hypothetical protein
LLGLTVLFGQIVFLGFLHDSLGLMAKDYWMFLPTIWMAIRLELRGTTIALIIVAVQALSGAMQGIGFFADDIAKTHLLNYWLYIFILSTTGEIGRAHV